MIRDAEFEQIMAAHHLTAMTRRECEELWNLLMRVPSEGLVVEVGCQLGRSSSLIQQAKNVIGFNSIHIDPYTDQESTAASWLGMMMAIGGRDHTICFLCMRTEQAEWCLGSSIDLAFIDGDHQLEGVRSDLQIVASKIRRGGYLACHDVDHPDYPGVRQALDEFLTPAWHTIGYFDSLGVWIRK
jgi:predicted O-methyltransferase YrrM